MNAGTDTEGDGAAVAGAAMAAPLFVTINYYFIIP